MAIVKLTEILPMTTTDVKLSGRKPRGKNKKNGVHEFTNAAWMARLEDFLKYCGWQQNKWDALVHPNNAEFIFEGGDFIYNNTPVAYIDKDTAEDWQADDTNFLLFTEIKHHHFHERHEVKLK